MASVIKLKRSSTGSAVPSSLETGELAINLADKKLFTARANGQVVSVSGDSYNMVQGGNTTQGTVTLTVDNASLSNDSIVIAGTNGSVVSGNSTQVTVDSTTYVLSQTGNSTVGQIILTPSNGGDGTTETLTVTGADGIAVSGNSTVMTITGEDYDLSAGGSATTGTVVLTGGTDNETVTFNGGENITITNTSTSAISVSLDDTVELSNTGTVTIGTHAANVVANSTAVIIRDANESTTIDKDSIAIAGDAAQISVGNTTAYVKSNTTSSNTTTIVNISNATDSSSNTTGGLIVAGGAGFGKSVTIGENLTIHGNFTVDGTTTTVNSSTVTIDDAALKLADNQGDTTTFTDAADFGFYGEYGNTSSLFYSGIFRDASANTFVVVNSIGSEPGATVTYTAANSTNSGNLGQLDAIIDGGSY
jgi:hypothetical protein|tara:strand:- start:200 stop:1459 length:1260 start_codon:yes stop_codon:yes gene_type:complete